jgi:pimeloyl-ACP methyl ester carboxylesterase
MEPALVAAEEENRFTARRETILSGFREPPDPAVLDFLVGRSLQMPSWAAVACYRTMLNADLIAELDNVTLPVLQIIGAGDPVHSAKGARWLAAHLSDARIVEIPECGHYPMYEAPGAFHDALLAFVSSR